LSGSTWKYRLLAFFVLGILICCAGSLPVRGQQSTELTAKRALLQELSGQVDEAKQQLLSIKKQEKGVLAELENTEMRLEKVRSRLNSLERQIKDREEYR